MPKPAQNSADAPFDELRRSIAGDLHTDLLWRCMLSTDASIFQKLPRAVLYPRSAADVQAAVRFAAAHGLSVHARGAGSGLCGSAVGDGIVVDFSKFMNRLLHLDRQQGFFICEPGYRFGELEAALRGSGLFFPPDPSSGEYATFGGMCATNASGAHSVKYGNVADYLLDAELVWADGGLGRLKPIADQPLEHLPGRLRKLARMYRDHAPDIEQAYPPIACNVAGYNLRGLVRDGRLHLHRLLAGSEGTLAIATRLTFRLARKPAADSLVVAYFDDIGQSARAVQLAMALEPSGIEIMDKSLLRMARDSDPSLRGRIPEGVDNVLLIEFDGPDRRTCARAAETVLSQLAAGGLTHRAYRAVSAQEKEKFWALRKAAVPILYKLKGRRKILALVEDAAVPVHQLAAYFKGIYEIFDRLRVDFVLYGHIAKGLMHTRPLLDLKDPGDIAKLKSIADAVYELVAGLGGTVSGEHGDGRLRSAYLQRRYPRIYDLFVQTKRLLDPADRFNPEIKKADDPACMTRHLRYGATYRATDLASRFLVWDPSFVQEAETCHGCTKCTTVTTATRMCPVYKFTRDETAAPKAKANVLRALISGVLDSAAGADRGGVRALYDAGLQDVMAKCVNCGSCYMECPSNVNIPKLAMEAKAHYVQRYGTSPAAWLTANVELCARLAHRFSPAAAPLLRLKSARRAAGLLTGLAAEREIVAFARRSLYQRLPAVLPGRGPRVLFFAGCYAAYIRPALGEAAARLLNRMGMQVYLPAQHCCGLPQLSKGMAGAARVKVGANLRHWRELLGRVDAITVTCSSCGYALMQDWSYLVQDRAQGRAAARVRDATVHITRLIERHRASLPLRPLSLKLAYHHPCHLRLQAHSGSSLNMLAAVPGVDLFDLQSHCCGIAGSWGMEARNYQLSRTIGTPMSAKLNAAAADFGVTDCPTCQMQMEHMGNPPVRHPIEILWAAVQA
jgi:FAD/FMN-containing dehydrogenase/Fe-S oxidoreductase